MSTNDHESTGWQLDQQAPEAYEQFLVPPMFAPWAERLLDTLDVDDSDHVLDVACGTGIVARQAASRVGDSGSVAGVDVNEGMLEMARTTAARSALTIDFEQGEATALPFPDEAATVVCCQQALQFVDDPVGALEEMRRVLEPGGRLGLSVWRPLEFQPGYAVLADALDRHVGSKLPHPTSLTAYAVRSLRVGL